MTHVLIVDDEPHVLTALQRALRQRFGSRLKVEIHTDAATALSRAREVEFEIVLSDLRMPEVDGISFLTLIAAVLPDSMRMMLTGTADFETAQRAINDAGVFRYLSKPWSDALLASHIEAALQQLALTNAARAAATAPIVVELGSLPELDGLQEDPQATERRRLEALEPGITSVEWGPQGEVLLPER